jgi:thiol:disulfide interchange protein DsbD
VAFLTWIFGLLQARGRARAVGWIFAALGLAVMLGLPFSSPPGVAPVGGAGAQSTVSESGWRRYDRAAIRAELDAGRPVFVDFTADWCITCKVNERAMIADGRVQSEFDRLDVALFRADFTRYDDEIRAELARFGKAGVPLYLLYRPEAPDRPAVLPELLTVKILLRALGRIERSPRSVGGVP